MPPATATDCHAQWDHSVVLCITINRIYSIRPHFCCAPHQNIVILNRSVLLSLALYACTIHGWIKSHLITLTLTINQWQWRSYLGKVSIFVHRTCFYPEPEEDGRLVFISLYLCSRQLYSVQLKLYCPRDLVDSLQSTAHIGTQASCFIWWVVCESKK